MSNTVLDDMSAVIGFTATQRIAVWFGDTNLYVPTFVSDEQHALSRLIGDSAYAALVREFGGKTLWIPHGSQASDKMQRQIAEMIVMGTTRETIADLLMLSPRRIQQLTDALREKGLIALVAKRRQDSARKNRWQKSPAEADDSFHGNQPGKTPQENAPGNAGAKPPGKTLQEKPPAAGSDLVAAWAGLGSLAGDGRAERRSATEPVSHARRSGDPR